MGQCVKEFCASLYDFKKSESMSGNCVICAVLMVCEVHHTSSTFSLYRFVTLYTSRMYRATEVSMLKAVQKQQTNCFIYMFIKNRYSVLHLVINREMYFKIQVYSNMLIIYCCSSTGRIPSGYRKGGS